MLWVVELVYRWGGKEEHFVWSVKLFFSSPLFSSSPVSLIGACLFRGVGAHGWVVRFC